MYNAELKTKFIREYTNSTSRADTCLQAFDAMQPYEEEWGADFCTRAASELAPVIEKLVGFRARSRWQRIIVFQKYVKWCIANNVDGACDGMIQIDSVGLGKVRSQMVANPTQLQMYLDIICDAESEQTTDNIYRCFYWMAYSGMSEDEILETKVTDVDFDRMVIKSSYGEYEIYRESIPAIKNAATLTSFIYKHPNYPPDKIVRRNRVLGNELIRGIRGSMSAPVMRVELSRRSKKFNDDGATDKQLSHYRAWLSGLFYRMYQRELAGIPVDFSGAAARFMEGKTYKLDTGRNTQEAKKRAIVNDYMQDYERWKAAFQM